jgi:ribosome assembly protein 1
VHPVGEVAAGNIVGIVGLEGLVLKTATLASTWACEPMRAITFQAKPMVCVAVEPLLHQNLSRLEAGLQSLYQVRHSSM